MGIRVCLDRCIKSTEYQIIIIRVAYDVGYDLKCYNKVVTKVANKIY